MRKLSKKSLVIVVIIAGCVVLGIIAFLLFIPRSAQAPKISGLTSTIYEPVSDICPLIDVQPLEGLAGDIVSTEKGEEGVECFLSLKGVKQPDGQPKDSAYNIRVAVAFADDESDATRKAFGADWEKTAKASARTEAEKGSKVFSEQTAIGDGGFSTTTSIGSIGLLSHDEHVWVSNVIIDVSLSGRLKGMIKGDEYNSYTMGILEGTLKNLENR